MPNNYQEFKKDLFNPQKNKELLFYKLKHNYPLEEQIKTIKQIPKAFNGLLYGHALFKSENDFGKELMQYKASVNIQLNWDCHLFLHYADEINKFLSLKSSFETNFLKGNYEEARLAHNDTQSSICSSYWGLENLFLLTQYDRGLEYNFKLLNECKEKTIKDGSYFMYTHFFSYKVEEDISFFSYENNLNSYLKHFGDGYKSYFSYRLNPMEFNYTNLDDVLQISTKNSLIDRYIVFRDILAHLLPQLAYQEQLLSLVKYLTCKIKDPLLIKIVNYLENSFDKDICTNSITSISIIDNYTTGNYKETILLAAQYLNDRPIDFGILELFVKAHIFLDKTIEPICVTSNILDRIASFMYDYLKKGDKTTESFVDLLTLTNAISSFDLAKSLLAFMELDLEEYGYIESKKSYLFSKTFNPGHYHLFKSNNEKNSFLDSLSAEYHSITVDFFKDLINVSKTLPDNLTIPDYRIKFYQARVLMSVDNFKSASSLLESIVSECFGVGFFQEAITHQLFTCYANLEEIDKAIILYVNQFVKNNELTSRIDGKVLANRVVNSKFKNVTHNNIELPIFIYLAHEEAHAKFIAYDVYMRSIQKDRPTQLSLNNLEQRHLIFFLKNVATPKIISKKVLVFKNSSEVLKERIGICQMLFKIDISSTTEYSKEISENTQRLIVQQRIKEIDQSMIYVDENGIIAHELAEINKNFNRFRNISELLKLNKIDATGINLEALYSLVVGEIDTDAYKRSLRKTNIHFQVFEQLFLEIRDKFLFSNHYGLDYYLSQRIRHGTIIGQLRKHFQEHNLVTSKDTAEGTYLSNKYWLNLLDLTEQQKEKFSNRMTAFSIAVDKIILDLKDKSIQIKTEDPKTNQSGWFNYMYIPEWNVDELRVLFLSKIQYITDFQEFVTLIFEVLWTQTTSTLESIRFKIESTVKVSIISIIDDLELDLVPILGTDNNKAIFKSIADCRTSVQQDVDAVVRWFNKSKSDEVDFTLSDAFNTSLTIVNNINSPFTINFEERLESTTMFKGAFFSHFVDLLKIFITNIFNYYRINNLLNTPGEVTFIIAGDVLNITFGNILAKNEDLVKLELKIEELRADLNKVNYKAIRGEGNTGFSKANNIVKNVFRNTTNEIKIKLVAGHFITNCLINIKTLTV